MTKPTILKFENLTGLQRLGMQLDPAVSTEMYYKDVTTKEIKELNSYKGVYNMEQKKIASVVSNDYTIVQHRPVVEAFTNTLRALNINSFGTIWNYGNRMYIDAAFDDREVIDGVKIGIRLKNSYDKYTSFGLEAFGYRTACKNGMFLGKVLKKELSVNRMHIGKIDVKTTVTRFIKTLIEKENKLKYFILASMEQSIDIQEAELLLKELPKKHINSIIYNIIDAIGEGSITRWQLYNTLTWYSTHIIKSDYTQAKVQDVAQKILVTPIIR